MSVMYCMRRTWWTYDMRFLFRFQFLMELAQARGPVMMGICQQRRAGEWLRAGSPVCRMLVDHLAWGWHGGIVEVEIHEDDGSSTARLRGGTVSREGGARGSCAQLSLGDERDERIQDSYCAWVHAGALRSW